MDLSRLKPFLTPAWRPLLILGLVGLAIWGFWAGSAERAQEAQRERPVSTPQRVSIVNGETTLTLDPAAQTAAGIMVAPIHITALSRWTRAYGVAVDPQALSDLHNSYIAAQAQLGMAQAKLHQSQLAYTRAERLLAAQADSAANRDAAEAQYRVDQATLSTAKTQLQTLAANAEQNWGAVLGASIVKGDETFARLVTRRSILLQVSLSPGQMLARAPANATVQLENGTRLAAIYLSDLPKADPHIQGAGYFYVAPANAGLLPNMNVVVWFPSDGTITGAPVPASAIVWWQGQAWAYQRTTSTHFVRRALSGNGSDDGEHVVTGLDSGAFIVVRGAQALLSEEARTHAPATGEDEE